MLIREVVTANKPAKPQSPQQQRVTALKRKLDQARETAKRQRLAGRQARLTQARAALNKSTAQ